MDIFPKWQNSLYHFFKKSGKSGEKWTGYFLNHIIKSQEVNNVKNFIY